jgi:hypothetical protein
MVIGIEGMDGGVDMAGGPLLLELASQPQARTTALVGDGTAGNG